MYFGHLSKLVIIWICYNLTIHFAIDGHKNCLHNFAIRNNAFVNVMD